MSVLLKTWNWEEPYFTTEEIKEANKAIKNGYTRKEPSTGGARKNNKPLKNIEPEIASVSMTSYKTQEAIHQAIRICQYEFGIVCLLQICLIVFCITYILLMFRVIMVYIKIKLEAICMM